MTLSPQTGQSKVLYYLFINHFSAVRSLEEPIIPKAVNNPSKFRYVATAKQSTKPKEKNKYHGW